MTEHGLSVACGNIAAIWRPDARENGYLPIQHHDECRAVAWNHNNKVLASGGAVGRLAMHYHNAGLMGVLPREEGVAMSAINDLSFSRGSKLIAAAHDSAEVQVWDLKNQVLKHVITNHSDAVSCVSFSPHDLFLASGSVDGALFLHDAQNRGGPVCLVGPNTARQNALHSSHTDAAVASANEEGHISVWDASKHTRVWSRALHRGAATGIRFSPMTVNILLTAGTDARACIVDRRERGDHITEMLPGSALTALSCRDDGACIALGNINGDVILYDPRQLHQALARKRCAQPGGDTPVTALNWTNSSSKPKRASGPASSVSTSQSSVAQLATPSPPAPAAATVAAGPATPESFPARLDAIARSTELSSSHTNGIPPAASGSQNGHAAIDSQAQPSAAAQPPQPEVDSPSMQAVSVQPKRPAQPHASRQRSQPLAPESAAREADADATEEIIPIRALSRRSHSRSHSRGSAGQAGAGAPPEQEGGSQASSGALNLDAPMDAATERFNLLHETMRRMHLEMIRQFSILQVDVTDSIESLAQQQNSVLHNQATLLQQQHTLLTQQTAMGQQLSSLQAKVQELSNQPQQKGQSGNNQKSSWNM